MENIKISHKSNKFKKSAPIQNKKFELRYGLYSVSAIQEYFDQIIKNYQKVTDNPPIRIYVNKMENRTAFKIETGYYLKLLTPKSMKLLGSTKSKINKNENVKNVPNLEITEVALLHYNITKNNFQQYSRV